VNGYIFSDCDIVESVFGLGSWHRDYFRWEQVALDLFIGGDPKEIAKLDEPF